MYDIPEMMFKENREIYFYGLTDLIQNSFEKIEYENRKDLISSIALVGGNSLFPKFIERL